MQWIWDHMALVTVLVVVGILLVLALFGFASAEKTYDEAKEEMKNQMMIVDRKELKTLLEEARKQGKELNVAIYVFNDKTGLWDRARILCGEK